MIDTTALNEQIERVRKHADDQSMQELVDKATDAMRALADAFESTAMPAAEYVPAPMSTKPHRGEDDA